jgi:hypothetical protein
MIIGSYTHDWAGEVASQAVGGTVESLVAQGYGVWRSPTDASLNPVPPSRLAPQPSSRSPSPPPASMSAAVTSDRLIFAKKLRLGPNAGVGLGRVVRRTAKRMSSWVKVKASGSSRPISGMTAGAFTP